MRIQCISNVGNFKFKGMASANVDVNNSIVQAMYYNGGKDRDVISSISLSQQPYPIVKKNSVKTINEIQTDSKHIQSTSNYVLANIKKTFNVAEDILEKTNELMDKNVIKKMQNHKDAIETNDDILVLNKISEDDEKIWITALNNEITAKINKEGEIETIYKDNYTIYPDGEKVSAILKNAVNKDGLIYAEKMYASKGNKDNLYFAINPRIIEDNSKPEILSYDNIYVFELGDDKNAYKLAAYTSKSAESSKTYLYNRYNDNIRFAKINKEVVWFNDNGIASSYIINGQHTVLE